MRYHFVAALERPFSWRLGAIGGRGWSDWGVFSVIDILKQRFSNQTPFW